MITKAQHDPCALKRDADGIKVYTCESDHAKFKSLRVELTLNNTSWRELKDLLWDVQNYQAWQYNTIEADLISMVGSDEMSYRALVNAPWPVEDREVVVNLKVESTSTITEIFIHAIPYEKAPPAGVVRVPVFDAYWKVTTVNNNLEIIYTLRIDPGGSVPAWLANIAMAEGPQISFRNLKKLLTK